MNRTFAFLVIAVCLSGCAGFGPAHFRTYAVDEAAPSELNYHGLRLRSGQIVVGDADDADSLLMQLMGEEFSQFVHAGILVIEKGRPMVYDGFAVVNPLTHGPPTRSMTGGIRRVTFEEYASSQRVIGVFEPPVGVNVRKVAEYAQARSGDGTQFDAYFDWRDHTRLYCTEFVALALHAGGADLPTLIKVRQNASLHAALEWLQVDAPEIVTAESLLRRAHQVALLSRDYSSAQVSARTAAKQELHARFTNNQKLGNVWEWTWRGLALRPAVAGFLQASIDRPDTPTDQLARESLGIPAD